MRWRGQLSPQEVGQLRSAALTLFGPREVTDLNFWQNLTLEKLKKAFREKAKFHHPDLQSQLRPKTLKAAHDNFIVVKNSYEVLKRFLGADLFRTFDG